MYVWVHLQPKIFKSVCENNILSLASNHLLDYWTLSLILAKQELQSINIKFYLCQSDSQAKHAMITDMLRSLSTYNQFVVSKGQMGNVLSHPWFLVPSALCSFHPYIRYALGIWANFQDLFNQENKSLQNINPAFWHLVICYKMGLVLVEIS